MDEQCLISTARYVELNPERAKLVKREEDYTWSSAKAHLQGEDDILVKVGPLPAVVGNWQDLLDTELSEEDRDPIRQHERTGRPMGSEGFLSGLEQMTGRVLKRQKPGPKMGN